MIGQTISHYRILEKLGEGGMGVVYKAHDIKLDRIVALKFLPHHLTSTDDAQARFLQEARAASALNHPNVCTIHDIAKEGDQQFIVMEYVDGNTLRRQLESPNFKLETIINYSIQIGEALQEAHSKGIVHRDIKTDNIMVNSKNQVKVMDFGLAKLKGSLKLTKTSSTVGTLAYMAPEQIQGASADARSDIFSFGVVLYEMLTGHLPFRGEHEAAMMYSIMNEEPEPLQTHIPDVPSELIHIVGRALEKDPRSRYTTMDELLIDLRRVRKEVSTLSMPMLGGKESTLFTSRRVLATAAVIILASIVLGVFVLNQRAKPTVGPLPINDAKNETGLPSIAVLPFVNMSPDPDNVYFSDGLSEEIINALSKLERLHVIARTSAFRFRGKDLDIREIGKQLNVNTVLEGSVRKAGNKLRITAQLINVADGYHLWSERYERELKDVFAIQDEISLAIVDKLKVKLLGDDRARLGKHYTENFEVYDLYLKGRYDLNTLTKEGVKRSLDYFQQAIQKDTNYALAYVGLASVYNVLAVVGQLSSNEAMPKAKSELLKALRLDNSVAEAHAWLGEVYLQYDWDWPSAEREFRKAIELKPNSPEGHQFYADYLIVAGSLDQASIEIERARDLDPLSAIPNTIMAYRLFVLRQFDQVIEHCRKMLKTEPSFLLQLHLWRALRQQNRLSEALVECKKLFTVFMSREIAEVMERADTQGGYKSAMRAGAKKLVDLSTQRYISPYLIATLFAHAEDDEVALQWFEKAYEERDQVFYSIGVDPDWDRMRAYPRFTALVKKIGRGK